MKKTGLLLILAATLLVLSSSGTNEPGSCGGDGPRKSSGPPSCYAGEPPLLTTCGSSGCHDDSPINSDTALVSLNLGGADFYYSYSQQYTISINLKRTGLVRGGFQIVALQDSDISKSPGIITLTDLVRTQRIDASDPHPGGCATQDKVWIEHTLAGIDNVSGDSMQWQFNWLAPATNVGPITFYLAAIDANNDMDNTGDHVYTLTKTINAQPVSTSINQTVSENEILFYPNPVTDVLYFKLPENEAGKIKVFDATGKLVMTPNSAPAETQAISLANLPAGVYMLSYQSSSYSFGKRVVKE